MSNFSKIVSNLFNKENEKEIQPVVKPKGKELTLNTQEESNMKIFNENNIIDFDFKVYGRSIFQNLILTANALNKDKELIPIKCKWRRVKNDIVIKIKDISSNSYLPTAEDIGYIIEVEVIPIDNIYGTIPSIGQYGPILLGNDMKNTLEILLTSGGTKFSCHLYYIIENEKVTDKEIILYINTHELKLVEVDYNGKEKVLEETKYHQMNPIITPHHNDIYRFTIKFYSFEVEGSGLASVNNIKQTEKSVYHLVAMSKQCRELIYLLVQFFLLDEKIKNSKLFTSMNYNKLPHETKVGVTDLISEIKTLREENSIILNNMKILEKKNVDLIKEMKSLEEDFQVTLETINSHMNSNIYDAGSRVTPVEIKQPQYNNSFLFDLKKKYDDLLIQHSLLSSKEKALREENKELLTNCEISRNKYEVSIEENKVNQQKLVEFEVELYNLKKSFTLLAEQKNKIEKEVLQITNDNNHLKEDNEALKQNIKSQENAEVYNKRISELQKQIETLSYDNKNLIVQRNVLTNKKEEIAKEFNRISKEKEIFDKVLSEIQEEKTNTEHLLEEKRSTIISLNSKIESSKKDLNDYKFKYELLEVEHNSLKQNFETLFKHNTNENHIKITQEEYEEYDQLKREKDETDAILMQLRSNNDAKDVEIRNLKAQIEKLKQ
jgi:chromosome segregation ATPase